MVADPVAGKVSLRFDWAVQVHSDCHSFRLVVVLMVVLEEVQAAADDHEAPRHRCGLRQELTLRELVITRDLQEFLTGISFLVVYENQ